MLQWDKDDCAAMGLVKFDLLGLGMLSALHYAVDLVAEHEGIEVDFARLDLSEAAVYEMLQRADSVGVFQVESRAQMATLPRLKPRMFYDLVVEVALIRPGPIQGGSVHPYIRRRNGLEPVTYDHPVMERSLRQDPGYPAVPGAADATGGRRAPGFDRPARPTSCAGPWAPNARGEDGRSCEGRFYDGMRQLHGITGDPADRIYERLVAFANFGFAESHALSLRVAGVLLVLAQAASPRRVLRGAAAGPADGLLLAAVAGRRRPPARRHRTWAGRQRQPWRTPTCRTPETRSGSGSVRSATSATIWRSAWSTSERPTGRS